MATRKSAGAKRSLRPRKPASPEVGRPAEEFPQNAVAGSPTSDAARAALIAEAAYYRAEKRGFAPGYELEDWLAAEAEITGCSLQRESAAAELH